MTLAVNSINDTISAISTVMGTGGVGIIRLSGEKSLEIITKIFFTSSSNNNPSEFKPNFFQHGWIKDKNRLIDEVMVVYFKNPKSFTGEDVVEINCHGGINVVKNILDLTLKNGARLAEKGEFTKRAFLNGKIDLSKAESILDIIHAKTGKFSDLSAQNLSGKLAQEILKIRKDLIVLLAQITAAIDFPEEVDEPEYSLIEDKINEILPKIETVLKGANNSNLMRQGLKLAIVGKPNVGKSSLFNTLLSMDRAIVTDIPGTTRDTITEIIDIAGIPVTLIDTAGIRELKSENDNEKIELIGIDISKQCIKEADIVLFMTSLDEPQNNNDFEIFDYVKEKPHLIIGSKSDLAVNSDIKIFDNPDFIKISTVTKEGLEKLKTEIKKLVHLQDFENSEFTTNVRQQECLTRAKEFLNNALSGVKSQELQDLISIDIKSALISLGEITGEEITEEILDHIFENFCIGK